MQKKLWMGIALFGVFAIAMVTGCETKIEGGSSGGAGGSGGGAADNGGSGGSGALRYYTTCEDPACMVPPMQPPGSTLCTTQMVGAACTTEGETCWPQNNQCGQFIICATSDPKDSPGGCPISRVSHKKNIEYLSEVEVTKLADEAMTMRLSSWHYNGEVDTARRHVGFLIDDMPASIAVSPGGERVDLYGYTSMAIAALQVQDKRLRELEQELQTMRAEVTRLRTEASRCGDREKPTNP